MHRDLLLLIPLGLALIASPLLLDLLIVTGLVPAGVIPLRTTLPLVGAGALSVLPVAWGLRPRPAHPTPPRPAPDRLLLGWDRELGWLDLPDEALMRHTLILGSSGSGKTQLLLSLFAQQIARGGGVLLIDAKVDGSTLQHILALCREVNRLQDLRVLWPPEPERSHTWNPLLHGSLEEILTRVMALWGMPPPGMAEEFFKGAALDIIRATLGAMRTINPLVTFKDLYLALSTPDILLWLEEQVPPNTEEAAALKAFLANYRMSGGKLNLELMKKLTGGAPLRISPYAWGSLGALVNTTAPTLDLLEAVRSQQIVYVALPILAQTEDAIALARMLLATFKQVVGTLQQLPEAERPHPPFLALLDEASAYSDVEGIERLFEQARSARVALVAASQVASGFRAKRREQLDFILGNTATKVVMSLGDPESAELMATVIGEGLRWFRSVDESQTKGITAHWIAPFPSRTQDSRAQRRGAKEQYDYVVRPEALMQQPVGQAHVLQRDPVLGVRLARALRTGFLVTGEAAPLDLIPRFHQRAPRGLDLEAIIHRREAAKARDRGAPHARPPRREAQASDASQPRSPSAEPQEPPQERPRSVEHQGLQIQETPDWIIVKKKPHGSEGINREDR